MNCPKCGSPLNPGDKFCQVCGSAVETTTPTVDAQPTPVTQPEVQPQPVVQPVPVEQPNPAPAVMPAPMPTPTAPVEPKKNNTLVVVLVAVIALLVVAIVAILFLGKNNESGNGSNNGNGGNVVAKEDGPKYSELKVGRYKVKLMDGYAAEKKDEDVVIYNQEDTAAALVSYFANYSITDIDTLSLVESYKAAGFESTVKETTIEGKKAVIFTGKYNTYDYEVMYVQVTGGLIGAEAKYMTSTVFNSESEKIHKMVSLITIGDSTTNANTNTKTFLDNAFNN